MVAGQVRRAGNGKFRTGWPSAGSPRESLCELRSESRAESRAESPSEGTRSEEVERLRTERWGGREGVDPARCR